MEYPMTTELVELAPCPLCGKEGPIFELIHAHTHHVAVFMPDYPGACVISCGQCGCAIMCEGEASQDDAVKRWNTRALASRAGGSDGWVSVTDRLPEPYQDVEVYPSWDDDTSNTYCPHDGGTNGRKAGNWYHNDREGYDHKMDVTHWRPRAKPPAAPEPVAVG